MTEAALVDPAITQLHPQQQETRKPLKTCVEDAMQGYFKQLEGHVTNDLYQMVLAKLKNLCSVVFCNIPKETKVKPLSF